MFPRKRLAFLVALVGIIVPQRLRADWRNESEAELQHRFESLAATKVDPLVALRHE